MSRRLEFLTEPLLEDKHSKPIDPIQHRVSCSKQLDFFDPWFGIEKEQGNLFNLNDSQFRKYANNVTLANFFEIISSGLYGGKLFNQMYVLTREGEVAKREGAPSLNGLSNYEDLIRLVKPDLLDQANHWIGEVKAWRAGKPYKFRDDQMIGYEQLQRSMPDDTKIDFVIYRHTVRDFPPTERSPRKYTDEELFEALSTHTALSVVLPFNLVHLLHRGKDSSWTYRDNGMNKGSDVQMRESGTCIRSPSINRIFLNPESFLEEYGLDVERYDIKRTRSPDEFYFGKHRVKPFPITIVRSKDYGSWVKDLKSEDDSDLPDITIEGEQPF